VPGATFFRATIHYRIVALFFAISDLALRLPILLVLAACESHGGAGGGGAKTAELETKQGSAGGFSASLSADLAREMGSAKGADVVPAAPTKGSDAAAKGSAGAVAVVPGTTAPGTTAPGTTAPGTTASGTTTAPGPPTTPGTTAPGTTAPGSKPPGSMPPAPTGSATPAKGSAAAPMPAKGSAAPPAMGSAVAAKGSAAPTKGGEPTGTTALAPPTKSAPANRVPVKPPPAIAAIKLDLEPNWERDVGEAGTFSLVVKVPNTNDTRVFAVHYGYEDQAAPFDCDQYRKYLEDKKVMAVTVNRQRGAACYIEGKDSNGVMSYRYLVNYDGKRLSCVGSLYKDSASTALGDLRDKVLMQAKKICETLAL